MDEALREIVRRLARDQWVRSHGTPRITVLAGGERARRVWTEWTELMHLAAPIFDGPFDAAVDQAMRHIARHPTACVAVLALPRTITKWREGRADRNAAMVDEGLLVIPASRSKAEPLVDARSAAEAALFEALEADRATTGKFELNGVLGVRFGQAAAEVDLLARHERIAIEIDGYFHFTDLDAWKRDRRKDLAMQMQGLVVIRVLAEEIMKDPSGAIHDVKQVLAFRLDEKARATR